MSEYDNGLTLEEIQAQWTIDDAIAALKSEAKMALDKTDMVAIRCIKAGIEFPDAWKAYVTALRQVINTGTGTIPEMPVYPS